MYDIEYKGQMGATHAVFIVRRPVIPSAAEEVETFRIAGRDGVLTGERYLSPLEIYVEMNFRENRRLWGARYREIKAWLSGSGDLKQSDDPEWFFKVLQVQIEDPERVIKKYGRFTAHFTCDPYMYRVDGLKEYPVTSERIRKNIYDESHPVYIVTGSGTRTLTVNSRTATLTVNGTTIVDTERMITYTQADHTLRNTRLSGDYEDLYLKKGENTITASDPGVTIIPNWRGR